jgi:ribosomal protein RSM22 (predicted rRNA methylase)
MHLPASLQNAIAQAALPVGLNNLTKAAAELSERYRQQSPVHNQFITSDAHRLAYAAVRMPATFAAVTAVLSEVQRRAPGMAVQSLLDLGAGTGAAAWAAAETFTELRQCTLIEQDARLIELGQRLMQAAPQPALREAVWQRADLRALATLPPHDLVVCSYSLGEIEEKIACRIWQAAWQTARNILIIIEPGTTKGFTLIRRARTALIEAGGALIAPCPHARACPMSGGDWCHFAARVERSALHRQLKAGELGYEDEKYSYVAFAKQPLVPANARILRHPLRNPGYIQLQLCAPEGLRNLTVTRRDKEQWRQARKADWGAEWNE